MKKTGLLLLLLISPTVYAETLSQSIFPAGKSVLAKILDSNGADVTNQYHFSAFSGGQLKLVNFNGKTLVVGSTVGTYNIQATKDSDQSLKTFPVSVTPGSASSITVFSGNDRTGEVGSSSESLKVKILDFLGNSVPNISVSFSVASGSASIGSAIATSDTSGVAQTAFTFSPTPEKSTVKASIDVAGFTKSVTFSETSLAPPNQPSKIAIASQPNKSTLGSVLAPISVKILDSSNVQTSYSGNVSVGAYKNNTCSVPSSQPVLGTLFATASGGFASFNNLQAQAAELLFLKLSAGGLYSVCSQAISVYPVANGLTSIKFTQLPTLLAAGRSLFPAVKVTEFDSNNQAMSNSTDQIRISTFRDAACSQPAITQLVNNEVSAVGGIATFPKLKSTEAKTIYLKASVGSVSSACSPALSIGGTTTECPAGYQIAANACVSAVKTEQAIAAAHYTDPRQVYYFASSPRPDGNFITRGSDAVLSKIDIGLALVYRPSDYSNGDIFLTVRDNDTGAIVATSQTVIHPLDGTFTNTTIASTITEAYDREQMVTFLFDQTTPVMILDNKYYTVWVHNVGTDNQIWRYSDFIVYGIK